MDPPISGREIGRARSHRFPLLGIRAHRPKKHERKPWLVKRWCRGKITGDYIWHMEAVHDLSEHPYDFLRPVVCFAERPCQLLGDVLVPIPLKPGRTQRQDYEDERKGTCCILLAFEPLRGWRFIQVSKQRTAVDYAAFRKELVDTSSPALDRIQLVQDNLTTHRPGSFYQALPPQDACEWARKFTLPYTPRKGSWLNMAESELSALSRQCLERRIEARETLAKEAMLWSHNRTQARKTVRWKFTNNSARRKLQKKYPLFQN